MAIVGGEVELTDCWLLVWMMIMKEIYVVKVGGVRAVNKPGGISM